MKQATESTSLLYTTDLAITAALSKEPDELKKLCHYHSFFHNRNMFLTFTFSYILPRCGPGFTVGYLVTSVFMEPDRKGKQSLLLEY